MGLGGHRGGGHHSHSSSSSSSGSSRSFTNLTTNNYGSNVSYGGWGGGWGGGTYYHSRPTPWTSGFYYNPAPVGDGSGRPPSQATSTCCCGCFMVCAATILMLIIVGNFSEPTHFTLDVAETRKWQYGNSAYTQSLHILDYSKRVEKYFVSTEPELESTPSSQPLIHEEHATLDGGDWLHFAYYLNKGSRVSGTFKVTSGSAHMYVIKGESDFDKWEDEPDENKNVAVLTKYSSNSQSSSGVYTVASDDVYYVVFDNDKDYASAVVEFSLRVERTQYILTGLTPACSADQVVCDLVVEQGDPRKYIVFSSPDQEDGSTDETFELDVYSGPRWSGIIFFWLFLPSAAVLFCYILPATYTYVRTGSWSRPTGLVSAADVVEGNDGHTDIELLGQTGFLVVADAEPAGGGDAMPTASVHFSDAGEKVFSSATAASESIPLLVVAPSAPPALGSTKV